MDRATPVRVLMQLFPRSVAIEPYRVVLVSKSRLPALVVKRKISSEEHDLFGRGIGSAHNRSE